MTVPPGLEHHTELEPSSSHTASNRGPDVVDRDDAMVRGPLPLVVGITGHRDLRPADIPLLEAALRGILRDLLQRNPNTPLIVLSSLAEGADRLGARVALEMRARLMVPLPMDPAAYERDFQSETSRAEFRDLLGRAQHVLVVPHVSGAAADNKAHELPAHDGSARDEAYERAGAFVTSACQILVAFWDGNETGRTGGTGENVRFKLNGVDPRYVAGGSPLDPPDTGPVIRIVTPRASHPPLPNAFAVETLYPEVPGETKTGERTYERRVFGRIETFNGDAVRRRRIVARDEERSAAQLSSAPENLINPAALSVRQAYAITDALALHFQLHTRRTLAYLFIWIFVAAALFEVYKAFAEGFHALVWVYATATGAAWLWYYVVNKQDYRSKFLDYRALAEGLRVQFFWWLAGIREDVASHYLRKQRGELDWIRVAAANANLVASMAEGKESRPQPPADGTAAEAVTHSLRNVLQDWVERQHDYYVRAALRDQRLSDRIDKIAGAFLAAAIGLTIAGALLLVVHLGILGTAGDWMFAVPVRSRLLELSITVLFVVAALLHNYAEKRALSPQAKQYERMSVMFEACRRRLPPLIDDSRFGEARHMLRELGREALNENADWVLLHRERPLELSVRG